MRKRMECPAVISLKLRCEKFHFVKVYYCKNCNRNIKTFNSVLGSKQTKNENIRKYHIFSLAIPEFTSLFWLPFC